MRAFPATMLLTIIIALILTGCGVAQPIAAGPATSLPTLKSTLNSAPIKATADSPPPQPQGSQIQGATKTGEVVSTVSSSNPISTPPVAEVSPTPLPTATPKPTLAPEAWKELPVIPTISDRVVQIYKRGLELGNHPQSFSKIGDCGSTPAWFLGDFDRGNAYFDLGPYPELSNVIQAFHGSYDRTSLAARSGFNASSLWVPLWADRNQCLPNEAPLVCEYRVHRPSIAFIMLGTNDVWHPEEFEPQMRMIIDYSIENGIIPILSTKADNQEGDGSINATIARLAYEYDIPLWNFWLAVQPLPDQGLQEDGAHLTWGRNLFGDSEAMSKAWPIRNLTALQVLDAVRQKISLQDS